MNNTQTTPADFGTTYAIQVKSAARRFLQMGRKAYALRFVACRMGDAQSALICATDEKVKEDISSGIKMLKDFLGSK